MKEGFLAGHQFIERTVKTVEACNVRRDKEKGRKEGKDRVHEEMNVPGG